jgi:hypothetical protein
VSNSANRQAATDEERKGKGLFMLPNMTGRPCGFKSNVGECELPRGTPPDRLGTWPPSCFFEPSM